MGNQLRKRFQSRNNDTHRKQTPIIACPHELKQAANTAGINRYQRYELKQAANTAGTNRYQEAESNVFYTDE